MSEDGKTSMSDRFKAWLDHGPRKEKKKFPWFYAGALLLAGLALMAISTTGNDHNDRVTTPSPDTTEEAKDTPAFNLNKDSDEVESVKKIENAYENQLKETLEEITGVSDVTVMVNLDSTEEKVYEKNVSIHQQVTEETDSEGGTRKMEDASTEEELVILRRNDSEEPVLIKVEKPEIRGVLVVAQGVDNLKVKEWVIEAVTRALDAPAHRVSVMPKKILEEEE